MKKFEDILKEARETLFEQPAPPPPPPPAVTPDMGDAPSGDMGGEMGGMPPEPPPEEGMENETKKEMDPMAYVEETLANLVNPQEGISPEAFSDWIDTFGLGAAKIQDKDGFKKFYRDFYNKLNAVIEIKDEMKDIFKQLHGTLKDVISSKSGIPQNSNAGEGRSGPTGPGV